MTDEEMGKAMLAQLRQTPEAYQERAAVLAGNAEFVLRMTAHVTDDTEVGKATITIREALSAMVPGSLQVPV